MDKILYFDCFSGASGDMVLGALHRSRCADRRPPRRAGAPRSGWLRTDGRQGVPFGDRRHPVRRPGGRPRTRRGRARTPPRPAGDPGDDREGRAAGTRGEPGQPAVPAPRPRGSRHPPAAGRTGALPRSRRPRLDHRHRRRGVGHRRAGRRPGVRLAPEHRQRHGGDGPWPVARAGACHDPPARRRARLLERRTGRTADADRRPARHRPCHRRTGRCPR